MPNTGKISEKRLFRTRSMCPKPLRDNLLRASTQNFSILDPPQLPDSWEHLITCCQATKDRSSVAVEIAVLGSTSNVYTVTLDFRPTCTCPNFYNKEDICKHIFFVLRDIVGLPKSSPILYQKAYLSTELMEIFANLEASTGSSNSHKLASTIVRSTHKKRTSTGCGSIICGVCDRKMNEKFKSTLPVSEIIRCPSSRCGGVFHADCVVMPDLQQLSLSTTKNAKSSLTSTVSCPTCYTTFDHDKGYVNLADVTGQSRVRDKSTYRPCPGYPGFHSGYY
jgi:hypothetical protein